MVVVDDLRTLRPIRILDPVDVGSGHGDGSWKRPPATDAVVARKKVNLLSEIMTRVYQKDDDNVGADEEVPTDWANTVDQEPVVTTAVNIAEVGSGHMQFPLGKNQGVGCLALSRTKTQSCKRIGSLTLSAKLSWEPDL